MVTLPIHVPFCCNRTYVLVIINIGIGIDVYLTLDMPGGLLPNQFRLRSQSYMSLQEQV